ncbi:NAD-dependent protein deacylase [Paenibacillus spiritus]|uniref:NAD-dependent protein deacetylase n=1 Tax=Paenibacillus spiritus TaxID=2496557 RepID=A0A5J5GBK5_9BACL|nr:MULTISPECIES: NAD-dependent protein deacylase [Paenibacillus]KAA9005519.1 NAD-dependent protein deacylase [Paenibacillus spiritus]
MDAVDTLAQWVKESRRIVFFGGAGTSTESGIPDFRSAAGLYVTEQDSPYAPEQILSRSFFMARPEVFFDFYRGKMLHPEARPGSAHRLLARLEADGKLTSVITQNIDGLHQLAGSRRVLELHGSVHRNRCMKCGRFFTLEEVLADTSAVPRCPDCGGIVKPEVVLYEEPLDRGVLEAAISDISEADLLLIGGTSLTVQPAAGLVRYFQGRHVAVLNMEATGFDPRADLLIQEKIGSVMEALEARLYPAE